MLRLDLSLLVNNDEDEMINFYVRRHRFLSLLQVR